MKYQVKKVHTPHKRRYKSVPHSNHVASILAKCYQTLKQEFNNTDSANFGSMSYNDIFQETILYVIQDKRSLRMSEDELLEHFKYRYNMIKFQIIQDSKLIYNTNANNLQAQEENK